MAQQNAHKVKIAARLRPRLKGELQDEGVWIERSDDTSAGAASSICVTNPRDAHQVFRFPFTSCYDEESTQEEIFENDVQPMIDVVFSGVTVTIFAYGVTSSGKTHTMQGIRDAPGVIPRVVRALFEQKEFVEAHDDVSLSISYMEIYKDECYDLLVDRDTAPKLPVRENDVGQVFVANLSQIPIDSAEEFDNLYSIANKQRSVGATLLNRASSRSHAIVTLHVKMLNSAENKTVMGKINLVDLAGSENNKLTGNDPSRMAESSAINKSLSVLGQVVHALNQGATRIPYRNSKLTRILQDALGGTSVGLLICNLAPGPKFRQDTLNTLNFAVRTKNVENKPVVNERDNRPVPKPHFAAVTSHVAPSKPANLPSTSAGSLGPRRSFVAHGPRHSLAGPRASIGGLHGPRPSVGGLRGHGPRPSLLPTALVSSSRVPRASLVPAAWGVPAGTSRVPRASNIGLGHGVGGANRRRSSGFGFAGSVGNAGTQALSGMAGLSEKEINEKISKLVELEVARRMEEKEKERLRDEEARAKAAAQEADCSRGQSRSMALTPERSQVSLPSGLLTPLLKRHQDLDAELRNRLKELERKVERGNTDMEFAGGLSPVSRKKTGRAYVALARQHSEKGDLQVALDLFRKAETYVPDNIKLKESSPSPSPTPPPPSPFPQPPINPRAPPLALAFLVALLPLVKSRPDVLTITLF
ncbi:kinesin-domain-containing protein [Stereum hirsutum FP-91666 SS1]|uniref:kinesin-domain-containing protein n=1 Tax=Stereum hirsutum (strain FP-91666) TaxID=721885 RepID=UPI000440CA97|nr:kinesin-domain-containing protein [Stereum hirsutum FP-91666 SS1]EIM88681.1 kinesin-domain-containing protein [Stereum hirsutum FP-91666 SS1]